MTEPIDHVQKAISRLVTQFREALNLRNYISSLIVDSADLENAFIQLLDERYLDTATGISLDILGEIVGQPRVLTEFSFFDFFGYRNIIDDPTIPIGTNGYGDINDDSQGSRYISIDESTTGNFLLDDETYRLVIRARIQRNIATGTIESIISSTQILLGVEIVEIREGAEAEYLLRIGKELNKLEDNLVNNFGLIPKPVGVDATYETFIP